jgi:hypothetical protein
LIPNTFAGIINGQGIIRETISTYQIRIACLASGGALLTRISYFYLTGWAINSLCNALSILIGKYGGTGIYAVVIKVNLFSGWTSDTIKRKDGN